MLGGIRTLGKCTISELTEHLGETKKALYYHIRKLQESGLIKEIGVISTGAPRTSSLFQSCLQDNIIPLKWDPNSSLETKRIQKVRASWGELMLESYHENRIAAATLPTRNRTISKMNWIHVTEEQKERIESLFETLREAIEEAEMQEHQKGDELIAMQYSIWLVRDLIGTGPLPSLRPIRKRLNQNPDTKSSH
ncbi:MAG: hypothetical protein CMJ38_01310 [Phycisphaerae bacterium]|nr:hypothetical protein [Phycisphaerae bacterium]